MGQRCIGDSDLPGGGGTQFEIPIVHWLEDSVSLGRFYETLFAIRVMSLKELKAWKSMTQIPIEINAEFYLRIAEL